MSAASKTSFPSLPSGEPGTFCYAIKPSLASEVSEWVGGVVISGAVVGFVVMFLTGQVSAGVGIVGLLAIGAFGYFGGKHGWFRCGLSVKRSYVGPDLLPVVSMNEVVSQLSVEFKGGHTVNKLRPVGLFEADANTAGGD